jgi:hypothetical protein
VQGGDEIESLELEGGNKVILKKKKKSGFGNVFGGGL